MSISLSLPPVIERELRVAARRGTTYWDRVWAAATLGVIFLGVMSAQLAGAPIVVASLTTFRFMAAVTALAVCSRVVALAAEAFAKEKRLGTLGLLFLTPLSAVEVAFGKLASSSLLAFCGWRESGWRWRLLSRRPATQAARCCISSWRAPSSVC